MSAFDSRLDILISVVNEGLASLEKPEQAIKQLLLAEAQLQAAQNRRRESLVALNRLYSEFSARIEDGARKELELTRIQTQQIRTENAQRAAIRDRIIASAELARQQGDLVRSEQLLNQAMTHTNRGELERIQIEQRLVRLQEERIRQEQRLQREQLQSVQSTARLARAKGRLELEVRLLQRAMDRLNLSTENRRALAITLAQAEDRLRRAQERQRLETERQAAAAQSTVAATRGLNTVFSAFTRTLASAVLIGFTVRTVLRTVERFAVGPIRELVGGIIDANNEVRQFDASLIGVVGSLEAVRSLTQDVALASRGLPVGRIDALGGVRGLAFTPGTARLIGTPGPDRVPDIERLLRVLTGLATIDPVQGIEGARFSVREALAGEFRSLRFRFELSPQVIAASVGASLEDLKADPALTLQALQTFVDTFVGDEAIEQFNRLLSTQAEKLQQEVRFFLSQVGDQGFIDRLTSIVSNLNSAFSELNEGVGTLGTPGDRTARLINTSLEGLLGDTLFAAGTTLGQITGRFVDLESALQTGDAQLIGESVATIVNALTRVSGALVLAVPGIVDFLFDLGKLPRTIEDANRQIEDALDRRVRAEQDLARLQDLLARARSGESISRADAGLAFGIGPVRTATGAGNLPPEVAARILADRVREAADELRRVDTNIRRAESTLRILNDEAPIDDATEQFAAELRRLRAISSEAIKPLSRINIELDQLVRDFPEFKVDIDLASRLGSLSDKLLGDNGFLKLLDDLLSESRERVDELRRERDRIESRRFSGPGLVGSVGPAGFLVESLEARAAENRALLPGAIARADAANEALAAFDRSPFNRVDLGAPRDRVERDRAPLLNEVREATRARVELELTDTFDEQVDRLFGRDTEVAAEFRRTIEQLAIVNNGLEKLGNVLEEAGPDAAAAQIRDRFLGTIAGALGTTRQLPDRLRIEEALGVANELLRAGGGEGGIRAPFAPRTAFFPTLETDLPADRGPAAAEIRRLVGAAGEQGLDLFDPAILRTAIELVDDAATRIEKLTGSTELAGSTAEQASGSILAFIETRRQQADLSEKESRELDVLVEGIADLRREWSGAVDEVRKKNLADELKKQEEVARDAARRLREDERAAAEALREAFQVSLRELRLDLERTRDAVDSTVREIRASLESLDREFGRNLPSGRAEPFLVQQQDLFDRFFGVVTDPEDPRSLAAQVRAINEERARVLDRLGTIEEDLRAFNEAPPAGLDESNILQKRQALEGAIADLEKALADLLEEREKVFETLGDRVKAGFTGLLRGAPAEIERLPVGRRLEAIGSVFDLIESAPERNDRLRAGGFGDTTLGLEPGDVEAVIDLLEQYRDALELTGVTAGVAENRIDEAVMASIALFQEAADGAEGPLADAYRIAIERLEEYRDRTAGVQQQIRAAFGQTAAQVSSIWKSGLLDGLEDAMDNSAANIVDIIANMALSIRRVILDTVVEFTLIRGLLNPFLNQTFGLTAGNALPTAGATGLIFSSSRIIPNATGAVLTGPTLFPLAGPNVGLGGEEGTEVLLPAERDVDGNLAVRSSGGSGRSIVIHQKIIVMANNPAAFARSERQMAASAGRAAQAAMREI